MANKTIHLLLTGAHGQLGHACERLFHTELKKQLSELGMHDCTLHALTRQQFDLSQPDQMQTVLQALRPQLIINTAAYTQVDQAEDEPEQAMAINRDAVALLASYSKQQGALLLHWSTDYVFNGESASGEQTRPYLETDPTAPLNVYGRSKAEGEQAIQSLASDYLLWRTSWVFGLHGDNFARKILRVAKTKAAAGETMRVVQDQIGAPTPAEWLAELAAQICLQRLRGQDHPVGLYHATAAGETNWHAYATHVLASCAGSQLLPQAPMLEPCDSHAFPVKAKRPRYGVLDTTKLRADFKLSPPPWQTGVQAMLQHDLANAGRISPAKTSP